MCLRTGLALWARPLMRAPCARTYATRRASTDTASAAAPPPAGGGAAGGAALRASAPPGAARVIYRGGPTFRTRWFLVAGVSFIVAGMNFSALMRDYLAWPLFQIDAENTPALMKPGFRYALAGGTLAISSLCGWYFLFAPTRMVTRLTVYPSTGMLGIRTALPAPSRYLPRRLRDARLFTRAGVPSAHDARERLAPLDEVFRLQGSAVGAELALWTELAKDGVPITPAQAARLARLRAGTRQQDQQETLLLRVGDARLAFQLSAVPQRASVLDEPPKHGLRAMFKGFGRGSTDWTAPPHSTASSAEHAARDARKKYGTDTEPWFLDRVAFDRLFPLDAARYKRTT
ncbi:hypothetical protein MSPP1_003698 [Malassezia sp. CBS 17886]|nr:hypothetical protein MSPP1_003698 [Malassezia sp. CBS 17886]